MFVADDFGPLCGVSSMAGEYAQSFSNGIATPAVSCRKQRSPPRQVVAARSDGRHKNAAVAPPRFLCGA
jgi:hypothetical protein